MSPITTPIKTGNKDAITNLQAALLFLLSSQSISLTADELNALQKQWQQEQQDANYGEATTELIAVFQQEYNVGDTLGAVEEKTAAKLNEMLKELGAFDEAVKPYYEKRFEFFKKYFSADMYHDEESFKEIYKEKAPDWPAIFGELFARGFNEELLKNLEFTDKLADWTLDNAALINEFQQDSHINSLTDIANIFDRTSFVEMCKRVNDSENKINATSSAHELYNKLFQLCPMPILRRLIANETSITIKDYPLINTSIGKVLLECLNKFPQDFNIKTVSVCEICKEGSIFEGIGQEKVISDVTLLLKLLQRAAILCNNDERIIPLLHPFESW